VSFSHAPFPLKPSPLKDPDGNVLLLLWFKALWAECCRDPALFSPLLTISSAHLFVFRFRAISHDHVSPSFWGGAGVFLQPHSPSPSPPSTPHVLPPGPPDPGPSQLRARPKTPARTCFTPPMSVQDRRANLAPAPRQGEYGNSFWFLQHPLLFLTPTRKSHPSVPHPTTPAPPPPALDPFLTVFPPLFNDY